MSWYCDKNCWHSQLISEDFVLLLGQELRYIAIQSKMTWTRETTVKCHTSIVIKYLEFHDLPSSVLYHQIMSLNMNHLQYPLLEVVCKSFFQIYLVLLSQLVTAMRQYRNRCSKSSITRWLVHMHLMNTGVILLKTMWSTLGKNWESRLQRVIYLVMLAAVCWYLM